MANKLKISDIQEGKKFARLTVLKFDKVLNGRKRWMFKCDCGTIKSIEGKSVIESHTRSCGCLLREVTAKMNKSHGGCSNGKREPEYNVYMCIIDRCENPNNSSYKHYGGKGITICKRWRDSYANFIEDMGTRPKQTKPRQYSIERVNPDKGYYPSNCKWATYTEQANNRSNNTRITFEGENLTLAQWSRKTGIRYGLLLRRISDGNSVDRVLTVGRIQKRVL